MTKRFNLTATFRFLVLALLLGCVQPAVFHASADESSGTAAPANEGVITNASAAELAAVQRLLAALPPSVAAKESNTLRFFGVGDEYQTYHSLQLEASLMQLAVSPAGALVKQNFRIIGMPTEGSQRTLVTQNIHEFFLSRGANNTFNWTDKRWPGPTDAIEALSNAARTEWERPAAGRTTPPQNCLLHLVVARRSGRWIALRRLRWEGNIMDGRSLQQLAGKQSIPNGYTLDPDWLRSELMNLPSGGAGTAHLLLQKAQNGWVGLGTAWAAEDKIPVEINDDASQARRAMRTPVYNTAAGHKAFGIALAQAGLFEEANAELEKAEALVPGQVGATLLRQISTSRANDPENQATTQLENEARVGLDPNHPSFLVSALYQDYSNQPSILRALRLGLEHSRLGDDTRSNAWLAEAQKLIQNGALQQASPSDRQWSQVLYDHLEERRNLSSIKPPLIVRSPLFVLRCWPNDLSSVQVLASLEAAQHTVYADFNLPMSCTEILSWRNQGEFQRYTTRFSSQGQSEFVAALTLTKLISTREGPLVLGEEINVFTDPRTAVFHTVAHEYGHVAVRQLSRGRDVPTWFNEGIASSVEGGYDGYIDRVGAARRARALLTMDEMLEWNVDGQRAFLAYSQANSIIDYIVATWGRDAVMNILRQIGTDVPPATAFQNVLGCSQHELWRRWVQSMK